MDVPQQESPVARPRPRLVRALRLAAAAAIVMALTAVLMAVRGGDQARAQWLVMIALGVGLAILIGLAVTALPILRRSARARAHYIEREE